MSSVSSVTGKTGTASTVAGTTGTASTVAGTTGTASTVAGKTGTASTVAGTTGTASATTGDFFRFQIIFNVAPDNTVSLEVKKPEGETSCSVLNDILNTFSSEGPISSPIISAAPNVLGAFFYDPNYIYIIGYRIYQNMKELNIGYLSKSTGGFINLIDTYDNNGKFSFNCNSSTDEIYMKVSSGLVTTWTFQNTPFN